MADTDNKLHWTQRIALIRHNLHAAGRSGDFTFFKTLQAAGFMEGTNHVAALSTLLEDDADTIMAAMDNFNAGLAYAHQDAFKNVYDNIKTNLGHEGEDKMKDARTKFFVDSIMQRNLADLAIDKSTSSVINLINQQPIEAQEACTNVWITGITIIADSVHVTLRQLDSLEAKMDDFIRMEESWNVVKAAVVCSITGLKGVFELMDPNLPSNKSSPRNSSIASASASVFRRLSNAFTPSAANSRTPSVASMSSGPPLSHPFQGQHAGPTLSAPVYRTPNFRSGAKAGAPAATLAPFPSVAGSNWTQHKLTTIPPTPAFEDSADPFDTRAAPEVPALPPIPSSPAAEESPGAPLGNPFEEIAQPEAVVV
ncbi:hypothetical protein AMS68_000713 [Peltaster fructicola]|uniref:Uncharacterized protein n=1 Tax=Peltaster fructicola TaxID=286661 RepID=A0A6H0XKG7_9PEZI|nr:hypothetical protein AMS68_000713 [Peltaster fructicola]